ncbi:NADH dehydrogenase 1 alpha subcomplex assembly factor 3 [Cokeromyces recurvatus]|uniref:NADH dehydrogenase 1 alpha subcomplex assembly factor 3 n=1 Tax=Cokeromyces recurvatus TaxID=90255 RepID=UPI0022202CC9|nr:NADH dehydrogenase 1 alpha subcomplex assembly factor 3 [Cokeromyces recurvatus]KAI7907535.1 NADH dehydrogenase 1 alpha subcomplex assembly factor 3 [Cokeromyces recurvatus]
MIYAFTVYQYHYLFISNSYNLNRLDVNSFSQIYPEIYFLYKYKIMLRSIPQWSYVLQRQNKANNIQRYLSSKIDKSNNEDWEQAKVERHKIANQAIPQPATNAIPSSMLASFNNMFDRGPNVGIEIITKKGFVLSNNVKVEQPLILLNGSAILWNAPPRTQSGHIPMKDWNLEAFKIFELISPRPELIMFGTGKDFSPLPEHIRQYFFKLGIQVDQMNSKLAAATYNVLAEEGRRIAAALLPLN